MSKDPLTLIIEDLQGRVAKLTTLSADQDYLIRAAQARMTELRALVTMLVDDGNVFDDRVIPLARFINDFYAAIEEQYIRMPISGNEASVTAQIEKLDEIEQHMDDARIAALNVLSHVNQAFIKIERMRTQ